MPIQRSNDLEYQMPQVFNYPFPLTPHLRLELPLQTAAQFPHSVSLKFISLEI